MIERKPRPFPHGQLLAILLRKIGPVVLTEEDVRTFPRDGAVVVSEEHQDGIHLRLDQRELKPWCSKGDTAMLTDSRHGGGVTRVEVVAVFEDSLTARVRPLFASDAPWASVIVPLEDLVKPESKREGGR